MDELDKLELLNEVMTDDVGAGKNKRQFEIVVAHNSVRDEWTAACGLVKQTAPSVADALHDLANVFDAIGAYGSHKAQTDQYAQKNTKPCIYCQALIFFGQLQSGKWLPLDAEPIYADQALGARLATFIDHNGTHMVRFPSKPQGRVWVPHPDVCGTNPNEPLHPALKRRWKERRDGANARAAEEKDNAILLLKRIAHDLNETEGDLNDDHGAHKSAA